jgi:hypothetical protein
MTMEEAAKLRRAHAHWTSKQETLDANSLVRDWGSIDHEAMHKADQDLLAGRAIENALKYS